MERTSIRKAIIPTAGIGTRFLPATKSVSKELLPILDTPIIQLLVEEIRAAGIERVILVTGKGHSEIQDHFHPEPELEDKLVREGRKEMADRLQKLATDIEIVSIPQKTPRGLGHAVLCAKDLIGNEPFLVVLGDDLVDAPVPCARQIMSIFAEYDRSVVSLMHVEDSDISRYGICAGKKIASRLIEIEKMLEKPKPLDAPSRLAIVGRYILTPGIFSILESLDKQDSSEIQLTDAIAQLIGQEGVIGYQFEGLRYDVGDRFGFLQANIAYGLKNPEIAPKLLSYMKKICG